MSQQENNQRLQDALQRFDHMPIEHSLTLQQEYIDHYLNTVFDLYADLVPEHIVQFQTMPFPEARSIIQRVASYGVVEGAKAFAFDSREPSTRSNRTNQVPITNLVSCVAAMDDEESAEFEAFRAACGACETLEFLLSITAERVVEGLLEDVPDLESVSEKLNHIAYDCALFGARTEFAIVRLLPETENTEWFIAKMREKLVKALPGKNGESEFDEDAFCKLLENLNLGTPPNVYPWPRDLKCLCDADLRPFIFCCNADNLIDPATIAPKIGPQYLYRCDDCQTDNQGFSCDRCGRSYSWRQGIVSSLNALQ